MKLLVTSPSARLFTVVPCKTAAEDILKEKPNVTHIHLSSIHFGKYKNEPYIHLNNFHPDSPKFDSVWEELQKLYYQGVTITAMVGGAGGAYQTLFSDFDTYYPLLKNFLKSKNYISGIDLDIEESVSLYNVKKLINTLIQDFGEDFIITMAPVATTLMNDSTSIAGFSYKELYDSPEGKHIVHIFSPSSIEKWEGLSSKDYIFQNFLKLNQT